VHRRHFRRSWPGCRGRCLWRGRCGVRVEGIAEFGVGGGGGTVAVEDVLQVFGSGAGVVGGIV